MYTSCVIFPPRCYALLVLVPPYLSWALLTWTISIEFQLWVIFQRNNDFQPCMAQTPAVQWPHIGKRVAKESLLIY